MYRNRNKSFDVLALFTSGYAKQFYLREISKLTGIPLKTTQTLIKGLEEEAILKSFTSGKNKYFKLNLDNVKTKLCLLQSEVHRTVLFIEAYPLFKTFLKELRTGSLLVVFGSFATFEAGGDSDLDLLVVSRAKERFELPSHLVPYKLHKIELSEASFIKSLARQEALIKEIEEKHIILDNHSFYVNAMWNYYGR